MDYDDRLERAERWVSNPIFSVFSGFIGFSILEFYFIFCICLIFGVYSCFPGLGLDTAGGFVKGGADT